MPQKPPSKTRKRSRGRRGGAKRYGGDKARQQAEKEKAQAAAIARRGGARVPISTHGPIVPFMQAETATAPPPPTTMPQFDFRVPRDPRTSNFEPDRCPHPAWGIASPVAMVRTSSFDTNTAELAMRQVNHRIDQVSRDTVEVYDAVTDVAVARPPECMASLARFSRASDDALRHQIQLLQATNAALENEKTDLQNQIEELEVEIDLRAEAVVRQALRSKQELEGSLRHALERCECAEKSAEYYQQRAAYYKHLLVECGVWEERFE